MDCSADTERSNCKEEKWVLMIRSHCGGESCKIKGYCLVCNEIIGQPGIRGGKNENNVKSSWQRDDF